MSYEKIKVWSILLRLYHWAFAGSIVTLVISGFYINSPWSNTLLEDQGRFPMAIMRYSHFLAGFIFTAALLIRIFLLLFGNKFERFLDFAPLTLRNLKELPKQIMTYLYLRKGDQHLGHNVLAGSAYLLTIFFALGQIISGFYLLYPESTSWQWWGLTFFGPQQQARNIHHLLMWYFIIFAFVHIYLVIWNDLTSRDGIISSIFTGDKFRKSNLSTK